MVEAWAPDADNYRATFVEQEPSEALAAIITGIGELTRGELAGERMNVAYSERSQEDEHSCFSDNTTADLLANELGIRMVITGEYPGLEGPGLIVAVRGRRRRHGVGPDDVGRRRRRSPGGDPGAVRPHLADGVPDDDPGRASVLAGIEALEAQADRIVAAADAIGVTIEV